MNYQLTRYPYPVIRIRSSATGEVGGQWYGTRGVVARVRRDLDAYTTEEPAAGWHVECRGEACDWHRANLDDLREME